MRFAGGVADHGDAVCEDGRHHQVLGAGDGGDVEVDARPAQPPGTRRIRIPPLLDLGSHQAQPLQVLLHAAHADVVATRFGDGRLAGARDQRAQQQERTAHPPGEVRAHTPGADGGRVDAPVVVLDEVHLHAEVANHLRHGVDVLDVRRVDELHRLIAEQRGGHHRQRRVLAA